MPEAYGIPIREPYPGELDYFRNNPVVAGMAADDNAIILNPYSKLKKKEIDAILMNEAARVHMRTNQQFMPQFSLTPDQMGTLRGTPYEAAKPQDQMATIAARLLSGDPSGGQATPEQRDFVERLRRFMLNLVSNSPSR